MINLEFKNKIFRLPTSYRELKLKTYREISKIDPNVKIRDRYIKIINILTGLSEDDIKSIDLEQIVVIQNNIKYLFDKYEDELVDRFKIGKVKYGFNKNIGKISFSEYIDLEGLSDKGVLNDNLHILMAILYRPIKNYKRRSLISYFKKDDKEYDIEEYNSDDVDKRSKIFNEELTMDIVMGAMVFFSLLKMKHIMTIQGFSNHKMWKMMKKTLTEKNLTTELQYG